MRPLAFGAIGSAVLTLTAALSLRAAEATLAVAAVTAVAVLFTWLATLHTTDDESGLALTGPSAALALTLVGRRGWSALLPLIAAQVVGAVIGGLAALGLDDHLGPTLIYAQPGLVIAGAVAALVGVIGTWAIFSIDGDAPAGLAGVAPVVAGTIGPLGLFVTFQPAAVIGLGTAGLLPWDVVGVATASGLAGAVIGAYVMGLLVPQQDETM